MQAMLPASAWEALTEPPAVKLKRPAPQPMSVQVATLPGGSGRMLRVELPPATPPGTYTGVVTLADGDRALHLNVAPLARLAASTTSVELTLAPGEESQLELEVTNTGNVPVEIRDRYACGLFDVAGLDRSLGIGFTSDARGVDRVGVIADELAASHGGLAMVRVHQGSGTIEPREVRTLRASLRVGGEIEVDRTYFGYWLVQEGKCTVTIRVTVPALREVT